ncbi:hypothetical protein ACN4EE_13880 [Geminocystis sp. CENA526]|uniref:hypothetical protein n=1 Tax=Geminocystis sp. CENA526 TaxID=1355871 RepID=UPI003D6EB6F6
MTKLLQEVFNKIEQLNPEIQDAIASRLLTELEDEKKWDSSFVNTTDEQWQKMADMVKQEILNGDITPLDDILEVES